LLLLVGQVSANDQFDGADEFIRAAVEHWEVPGVAIAAVKDGQVVLAQGYEAVGAIWKPSFFIREGSSSRIIVESLYCQRLSLLLMGRRRQDAPMGDQDAAGFANRRTCRDHRLW
jgi:hypothetical protein